MPSTFSSSSNAWDAQTVGEWWSYNLATRGTPRRLKPDWHYWTEPLSTSYKSGRKMPGPSMEWVDAIGWGRYMNSLDTSQSTVCQIGFDDTGWEEDTPCISLSGCRGFKFEGFNIFRKNPGVLFYDTNAVGQNSGGHTYQNIGMGTRYDGGGAYVDPYTALSGGSNFGVLTQNATNRQDYFGIVYEGDNGTDNFTCYDCAFFYLEAPYKSWSAQTTRVMFNRCFFRWCDNTMYADDSPNVGGEVSGAGNVSFVDCSWYDMGPIHFDRVKTSLSTINVFGGWYDTSDGVARTFIDAAGHQGTLNINIVGLETKPVSSGSANWVVRSTTAAEETRTQGIDPQSVPSGQSLYDGLTMYRSRLHPGVIARAAAPTETNPEFDLNGSGGVYLNESTGQMHFVMNNGGTLVGVALNEL